MKFKKEFIVFFLFITVLAAFFSLTTPISAQYQNQEKIPGASSQQTEFIPYLKDILNFGYAIIGILALFMLIIGAYQYLIAAGTGNVSAAKETIASALFGLILGVCAYIILDKINPDLVSFRDITKIEGTDYVDSSSLSSKLAFWNFLSSSSNTSSSYINSALSYNINTNKATPEILAKISDHATKNGLDPNLVTKVVQAESNFNPNATSPKGAMGLMQLMPATAAGYGVTDGYNIDQNLNAGCKFLAYCFSLYDGYDPTTQTVLALASYNAGPKNVSRYGGVPPFKETQKYVKTITGLSDLSQYKL